jgi:quinolinate synthase
MKKNCPDKEFIIVPSDESCSCNDCPYMKLNTLEKLYQALLDEKPEIIMDEALMKQAEIPIQRMLDISRSLKLV